jgi:hypothetical protein
MRFRIVLLMIAATVAVSCNTTRRLQIPVPVEERKSATELYATAAAWKWKERDSLTKQEILSGNIPSFLKNLVRVHAEITDSSTGNKHHIEYFVTPDYLSFGTDADWARIPMTPMAAQVIADNFHCFLPTRKMVDDIYRQAVVKLPPVPMYAFRDSSVTMWQHHLIIEGQRKGRKGLIAGIKKDVVISGKILQDTRPDREAIYGWHKPDGKPIQPLYTGHINWWVDYSHGIRLVSRTVIVDGKKMDYTAVMQDPVLRKLLCDEERCDCMRYATE